MDRFTDGTNSPHFSPRRVARPARCREMLRFRPRGPAGSPSVVRCVRHGSGFEAPRRRRCPSIAEERERRRRGHAAATLRADGGRGRSLRCSSSMMLGHRLPPRALISARETHRRTALGDPAGPRGRGARTRGTLRRAFGACVSPPPARVRWARLGASLRTHCAVVGGESTPRRENAADCCRSPATADSW